MRGFDFDGALVALRSELHCFAYKLTADKDETESLLRETMLRTLDNKDRFDFDTNFKGQMYTVIRNTFINSYRTKKVRGDLYVLSEPEYHFLLRDDSLTLVDNGYDAKEIREALKTLPKAHYVVFVLYRNQISENSHEDRNVIRYDKRPYLLQRKKTKAVAF